MYETEEKAPNPHSDKPDTVWCFYWIDHLQTSKIVTDWFVFHDLSMIINATNC